MDSLDSGLSIAELKFELPVVGYDDFRSLQRNRSTWKTIITRNTGTQETREDEDYKLKPNQNHCYGHTPQIQKGAKTSNSGVKRMPFVTNVQATCKMKLVSGSAQTI